MVSYVRNTRNIYCIYVRNECHLRMVSGMKKATDYFSILCVWRICRTSTSTLMKFPIWSWIFGLLFFVVSVSISVASVCLVVFCASTWYFVNAVFRGTEFLPSLRISCLPSLLDLSRWKTIILGNEFAAPIARESFHYIPKSLLLGFPLPLNEYR